MCGTETWLTSVKNLLSSLLWPHCKNRAIKLTGWISVYEMFTFSFLMLDNVRRETKFNVFRQMHCKFWNRSFLPETPSQGDWWFQQNFCRNYMWMISIWLLKTSWCPCLVHMFPSIINNLEGAAYENECLLLLVSTSLVSVDYLNIVGAFHCLHPLPFPSLSSDDASWWGFMRQYICSLL